MARDSQAALVALNRFGFGARGGASGDFVNAASDPRGFVKAELGRPNGVLLEVPGLLSTPALGKAMAPPPGPGRVSYTLAVTNNGPSAASHPITINDTLPAGLTLASATGAGWTCSITGQAMTCTSTTDLASGATSTRSRSRSAA